MLPTRQSLLRAAHDESGNSLVEFSLCATLLFMVVFGIMDMSRAVSVDHFLANAASEATRYASVRGATYSTACTSVSAENCYATQSSITNYIQSITPLGVNSSSVVVNATWPGTTAAGGTCSGASNAAGCTVKVKLTYSYSFLLAFLPKGAFALTSTATSTIAQ
jgi:Flp pilus assembly protein TadG